MHGVWDRCMEVETSAFSMRQVYGVLVRCIVCETGVQSVQLVN